MTDLDVKVSDSTTKPDEDGRALRGWIPQDMFDNGVNIPGAGICTTPFEILGGHIQFTARRYQVEPIGRLYTTHFFEQNTLYWELHLMERSR